MAIYICSHCKKEIYRFEPFALTDPKGNIFCETECALLYNSDTDEKYNKLLDEYCMLDEYCIGNNPLNLTEIDWNDDIFEQQDCQKFSGIEIYNILNNCE